MKRPQLIAGQVLAALAGLASHTAADAISTDSPTGVRSSSPALVTLIARATKQSPTFRGLIETIEASDGIVYVEVGECGQYVRSCLVGVTTAGRFRMLWIELDTEKTDVDLIASIAHELQHAVEILSDSNVRSSAGMFSFYTWQGKRARGPTAFETTAAIEVGDAVRTEIRATQITETVDGQASAMAPDARVRGVSTRVVTIINKAAEQSDTFRGLVDQITRTDGMVYVAEGNCGRGARACLLHTITDMGPHRVLRILVDRRAVDCDLIASIGHELQHAVEVLSYRSVRSASEMRLLYKRICDVCGASVETNAAVRAGNAVRDELRKNQRKERHLC